MKNYHAKFPFCAHHTLPLDQVRCILTSQCKAQYALQISIQGRCDDGRTFSSNPRGSEKWEKLLKIKKGCNENEELRVSSYLVLMVQRIVHEISRNQLTKFEGENHSRAPKSQIRNEMIKMRGKTTFMLLFMYFR